MGHLSGGGAAGRVGGMLAMAHSAHERQQRNAPVTRSPLRVAAVAALCAATALLALRTPAGAAAEQPGRDAVTNPPADAAPLILAEAERLEHEGRGGAALIRYVAAYALDPESDAARSSLVRLALAVPPAQDSDDTASAAILALSARLQEEQARREALDGDILNLTRQLREQESRLERAEDSLDDGSRAEPITDRLEREVSEVSRSLDRLQRDLSRLESEVRRLRDRRD